MGYEIERKFLIRNNSWQQALLEPGKNYCQGYLLREGGRTVRIRTAGAQGFITIKGKSNGLGKPEFEYEIPLEDAEALLQLCSPSLIFKTRFLVKHINHLWEIDVFEGDNTGLVVAEIELEHEAEEFHLPEWAGEEVTDDGRYSNASLSRFPFCNW